EHQLPIRTRQPRELSPLFFPRHASDDPPLYRDFFDDFGHRRSPGRIFAGRAGRAGQPDVDRSGKNSRRHDFGIRAGVYPAHPRTPGGCEADDGVVWTGAGRDADRLVRLDGAGALRRLADELDAGISRDHEPVSDPAVVFVGSIVPGESSVDWITVGHA